MGRDVHECQSPHVQKQSSMAEIPKSKSCLLLSQFSAYNEDCYCQSLRMCSPKWYISWAIGTTMACKSMAAPVFVSITKQIVSCTPPLSLTQTAKTTIQSSNSEHAVTVKSRMAESSHLPEVSEVSHQPECHILPRHYFSKSKVVSRIFKDIS